LRTGAPVLWGKDSPEAGLTAAAWELNGKEAATPPARRKQENCDDRFAMNWNSYPVDCHYAFSMGEA